MAIVLEEQKKGISWFAISVFIFLFLVVFGGGYYLFFAPTPGIEFIAPSSLRSVSEIAEVEFNPADVVSNPILGTLQLNGGLPTTGSLGRPNPLLGF